MVGNQPNNGDWFEAADSLTSFAPTSEAMQSVLLVVMYAGFCRAIYNRHHQIRMDTADR